MQASWTNAEAFTGGCAYRDWFGAVYGPEAARPSGLVPALVGIRAPVEANMRWLRTLAQAAGPGAEMLMDAQGLQRLEACIAAPPDWEPDFFVHLRGDPEAFAAAHAARLRLLPDGPARPDLPRPARPPRTPAPIVAVIDDAIGFLNARFARLEDGRLRTRLARVWLQAEDRAEGGQVVCGREIGAGEIDAWLARGAALEEDAIYTELNDALHGRRISPVWGGIAAGAGTERRVTHGTHVLDIAAGADPLAPDEIAEAPLLAVQLPPPAVEDTSGTRLALYILRALRWVIDRAAELDEGGAARPLVLNISLGVLAGAKDGTSLFARLLAAELARREAATGAATRAVLAFGNGAEARQVARPDVGPEAQTLTLRVQSEDYTPSFAEIRAERPEALRLSLEGLEVPPLPLGTVQPGTMRTLMGAHGPLARVYALPARGLEGGGSAPAWVLLALAPTASLSAERPLAPSGVWRLGLASEGERQTVRVEVQRDDRAMGFPPLARQTRLDDSELWHWRAPQRSPYMPAEPGPVTQRGTHSAYLAPEDPPQVWSVGAALADTGFAAPYSAVGAPWAVPEPGASGLGDSSWTLRGVMAAGTLSGTVGVVSGTSVAAPQIARALALFHASGPDAGPWRPADQTRAAELAALRALPWSFVPGLDIDRLGAVCVSDGAGLRPRLDDGRV